LCIWYSPYTYYSLLIRESCLCDILPTLITLYSSGRVVYLIFSIHQILITHQGELCIWHSPYTYHSLLIRESCLSDIVPQLIIHYSLGRVVHLAFSIHYLLITHQGDLCTWHSPYTNYSLLIREGCLSDILHTLITHYSSGRIMYLTFSINLLLITHQGELCIWHYPYTTYSLLIRESCVSDIPHTLIDHYSSVIVVYLTFSIHYLLLTHQGELFIWHSPYINYSLLIRESCWSDILHTLVTHHGEVCIWHSPCINYSLLIRESCLSDILHTLFTHYSSERVVYLTPSLH
jgi:hypothetical protein